MISKLFSMKTKETFTFFIPCSKNPYVSYREKELDSLAPLFNQYEIDHHIVQTIPHEKGFWVIIELSSSQKNLENLSDDPLFKEYRLYNSNEQESELEIISESDADFTNSDNFKV